MTVDINKNEKCIALFCKTVADLNTISLKQMQGYLTLASDAVKELGSHETPNGAAHFVNELKKAAEEISEKARRQEEEIYKHIKESLAADSEQSFCQTIEAKLVTAIENSLANQQQLNVTGNAILAQAASLLLSSAGEKK
jgi:hypothetical protein